MAKNSIQFQKGLSLSEFLKQYGTEEQCREALFRWRYPKGYCCPNCGYDKYCEITARKVYQCHRCHHQSSLVSGTIFHSSKLPLTLWFLAMYLLTQSKNGISSLELARQVGISQNAAWRLKHKLMQVMLERERPKKLAGRIEIDDAYLGGERSGGKRGRGAAGKTPFVAAVETQKGKPLRLKLSRVTGFQRPELQRWSLAHLTPGSEVFSDGLACFAAVEAAGCRHHPCVLGSGRQAVSHPAFRWVNTVLGNLKNALCGTYHAIREKHIPRYLAEFQYRFNRRFDLSSLIPRLAYAALQTPPMPVRLLTLAENRW